jgi:hypothetical protein
MLGVHLIQLDDGTSGLGGEQAANKFFVIILFILPVN